MKKQNRYGATTRISNRKKANRFNSRPQSLMNPDFPKPEIKEFDRRLILDYHLSDIFANKSEKKVAQEAREYRKCYTGLVFIDSISSKSIDLKDALSDQILQPVVVPSIIKKFMREKDLFLMTLGQKRKGWHLLFSSGLCEDYEDEIIAEIESRDI